MSRTSRRALWLVSVVLGFGFFAVPRAMAAAAPGYVNFMIGQKIFDSDWDPIDKQTSFGAEGVFGPAKWPVQMDAYLARASKSKDQVVSGVQGTFKATTTEFGFGANKTFGKKKVHPYVNAGVLLAKVTASFSQSGTSGSNDASHIGAWGGGGAFYRVGSSFNIGGAVRYSSANVDFKAYTTTIGNIPFNGLSTNAGGFTFGVLVGWGWPKTSG